MSKLREAAAKCSAEFDTRVGSMSSLPDKVESISTCNIAIDYITGIGGLPVGRITELYGPPASGKTTTAMQVCAKAQALGLPVAYMDHEQAMDRAYCKALGMDVDDEDLFFIAQPDTLEQGMNIGRKLVATGELGVIVFDSVASMVPAAELAADTGSDTATFKLPKLMAQAMRQLTGTLNSTNTCAIFVNHIQDIIDITPMGRRLSASGVPRTTTPGGKALKFYSSMRLEYKQIGQVKEEVIDGFTRSKEDQTVGTKVLVKCMKNKVAAPFKQCEVMVRFGEGFSQGGSVIQLLTSHDRIGLERGGVYRFHDAELKPPGVTGDWVRGIANMIDTYNSNPEWAAKLEGVAYEILESLD